MMMMMMMMMMMTAMMNVYTEPVRYLKKIDRGERDCLRVRRSTPTTDIHMECQYARKVAGTDADDQTK